MTNDTLAVYGSDDVSSNTDLRVCGSRSLSPTGCLLHTTSGVDSLQWLQGGSARANNPASADALITRTGHRYYLTPSGRYAYHAGVSIVHLDRLYSGNEVSERLIGIELECQDTEVPTYQQIDSLAELIVQLAGDHAWRWPFILFGHYAVARPLGRRSDPVNLDWGSLMGRLYVRSLAAGVAGLV